MLKLKLAAAVCALLVGGGVALIVTGAHNHHPRPIRVTPLGTLGPTTAVPVAAAQARRHRRSVGRRAAPTSSSNPSAEHHHRPAGGDATQQPLADVGQTGPGTTAPVASSTTPTSTNPTASTTPPSTHVATRSSPHPSHPKSSGMSITIPAIGVHAPVVTVGVTADHTIAVPPLDKPNETAWYDGSARPGQDGAAVILGHIDTAATGPAVFYNLPKFRPGNLVTIRTRHGGRLVYRVDGLREYRKTSVPLARLFGPVPYPGLRLISCTGAFDYATGHYVDNVVVYASIVS